MTAKLTLISHTLCPYVQRAAIALAEKGVAFDRLYIDLANKPDWFLRISPLGKTPVLIAGDTAIFESTAILEYLEDTQPNPLHPADPLERARHRGWIEFGSSILNDIAGFYSAGDETAFALKVEALTGKFSRLETHLGPGPFFGGAQFTLVDAVFGPVFRYFDTFDQVGEFGILPGRFRLLDWRKALARRPSVLNAVGPEYPEELHRFLMRRHSYLSMIMQASQKPGPPIAV
ncbi:glutathione S-transferase family protein [Puniceibacterium confluentis]|uniref:glutathione S-transferase family protein n=1 Tax=Puniceibacterium confluentis TaxID=1958944 RepID=UPI0011B565E1|nr:glutathione S-transferase family protein [Puniceibacterium confluentis]